MKCNHWISCMTLSSSFLAVCKVNAMWRASNCSSWRTSINAHHILWKKWVLLLSWPGGGIITRKNNIWDVIGEKDKSTIPYLSSWNFLTGHRPSFTVVLTSFSLRFSLLAKITARYSLSSRGAFTSKFPFANKCDVEGPIRVHSCARWPQDNFL